MSNDEPCLEEQISHAKTNRRVAQYCGLVMAIVMVIFWLLAADNSTPANLVAAGLIAIVFATTAAVFGLVSHRETKLIKRRNSDQLKG